MTGAGEHSEWIQLDFTVSAADEDAATEQLQCAGLPGWEVLEGPPGTLVLRVWVLEEDAERVSQALGDLASRSLRPRAIDTAWTRSWAPERVGAFVIRSLGAPEEALAPSEHLLLLAPELAFGGGEHPTTQLCLEQLAARLRPGDALLDVGSGSGVLSVAAARLGARRVEAVDVDPTARRATRRAAEANAVPIQVRDGGLEESRGPYEFVVANILAPVLIELAEALAARVAPGGTLVLSGIRAAHAEAVKMSQTSLRLEAEVEESGWVALIYRSPAP